MIDADSARLGAFARARVSAQAHMARAEAYGLSWLEETATELVLVGASPFVKFIPFTKRQEGGAFGTGADWLWWWVGEGGVSFGTLVQAKRLKKRDGGPWQIDFGYNSGQQLRSLLATADALKVAPTYALYFGSPNYRSPIDCGADDHPSDFEACERCNRKTVSFLAAILATPGCGVGNDPAEAYARSVPIEDLADPDVEIESPWVLPSLELEAELREFLFQPQSGPRKFAKSLIEQVCRIRFGQFSLAEEEMVGTISDDPVFTSLPIDQGHMYTPYFPQILRGLRRTPPSYVLDALAGDNPMGLETNGLAGLVIVDARSSN
ncbi:hypothetical protein WDJ51_03730 [Rathayibacter sp. YIM 133350]|uniref:hypothetical protein n=1 Tax=Rathayibacter sp. YIM 133350 TaxID=3131992 RepID=UPI00307F6E36